MFSHSARLYDAIYSWKDYAADADKVRALIARHKQSLGKALLDAACGTGEHLRYLKGDFDVEGLDLDPNMLAVARGKHPDIPFHQGDMATFHLPRHFDVILCLFSSTGYVRTPSALHRAIANLGGHLQPGGVLLVEPWFAPEAFHPGTVHALFIDQPELKVARMNISRIEGGLSILDFHYLVGTPEEIEHFTERHELGLFRVEDYMAAFEAAGLETHHDPDGLTGRGLYLGLKPMAQPSA
ncbi:MAG: methyltransferase domain-containing protein [Chloroflexota bacterium]